MAYNFSGLSVGQPSGYQAQAMVRYAAGAGTRPVGIMPGFGDYSHSVAGGVGTGMPKVPVALPVAASVTRGVRQSTGMLGGTAGQDLSDTINIQVMRVASGNTTSADNEADCCGILSCAGNVAGVVKDILCCVCFCCGGE